MESVFARRRNSARLADYRNATTQNRRIISAPAVAARNLWVLPVQLDDQWPLDFADGAGGDEPSAPTNRRYGRTQAQFPLVRRRWNCRFARDRVCRLPARRFRANRGKGDRSAPRDIAQTHHLVPGPLGLSILCAGEWLAAF